jgi:hypothetical protein
VAHEALTECRCDKRMNLLRVGLKWAGCLWVMTQVAVTLPCSGQVVTLSAPRFTNGNFSFMVQGESKAQYVVSVSTNALQWSPAGTNRGLDSSRTISVAVTHPAAVFRVERVSIPSLSFAALAIQAVNLNGNAIFTDSFDSTDPAFSTGGQYDSAKRKANGDVGCVEGEISVGNAKAGGHVWVSAGERVLFGLNGSAGDLAWVAGSAGVMAGYVRDDLTVSIPTNQVPFAGGAFSLSAGAYKGVGYDYLLGSGNYLVTGSLIPTNESKMLVTASNTVLYVAGNFDLAGPGSITLRPGASRKLVVGGGSGVIQGPGLVNPGSASQFCYYGLETHTNIAFNPGGPFKGIIHAPQAAFVATSPSTTTNEIFGAVIARTIQVSGQVRFHYDEALAMER